MTESRTQDMFLSCCYYDQLTAKTATNCSSIKEQIRAEAAKNPVCAADEGNNMADFIVFIKQLNR